MTHLPVSEEAIARHTTRAVYERGARLYRESKVHQPVLRGNRLSAQVEGYHQPYYQVEIEFTDTGISSARCSCAYEWGEWCKHIVATLLTCLHRPERVETRPDLTDLLEPLSREQLIHILMEIARGSEDTAARIETLASVARYSPAPSETQSTGEQTPPALRVTDFAPDCISESIEALGELGARLQQLIESGRAEEAIRVIESEVRKLAPEVLGYDAYYYDDFESDAPLAPFAALLAEAILSIQNPSESLKTRLATRVQDWHDMFNEYGQDFMGLCLLALHKGWGVRIKGRPDYFESELHQIELRLLEQRGDYQTYLEQALQYQQPVRYVIMLALCGELARAMDEAQSHLKNHSDWLAVVRAFYQLGAVDESLQLAQTALQKSADSGSSDPPFMRRYPDSTLSLAEWLHEHAQRSQRPELALEAAQIALLRAPTLQRYLAVKDLAAERWESLRPRLLKRLQKERRIRSKKVAEIFMHEGMYEQAFEIFQHSYDTTPLDMKQLAEHLPDLVSAYCIKEAEAIIARTRADEYPSAAEWLMVARQAHTAWGKADEWRVYIESLIEQNKRKRALVPLLELLAR